jgi:ATP-dependent DNA ligase
MAFDLLQLDAKDYRQEPLKVRRKALERLLKG